MQNVASEIKAGRDLTSKSGTLAYLAPEVYEGRGYGTEVDWWSLGVLFYECIYNKRPFDAPNHDLLSLKIVRGNPPFPTTNPPVSRPCLHAISSLLEKDRRLRIGASSWESFWDNPFFREVDFIALEHKEIEPVFVPSTDKTNFDATYDLEELLLEEAPLEARARRQKPRSMLKNDATEKEIREDELHRMIETLFEPFDFTLVEFHENAATNGLNNTTPPTTQLPSNPDTPPYHAITTPPTSVRRNGANHRDDPIEAPPPAHIRSGSASPVAIHARSRASTQSPHGSPPLSPAMGLETARVQVPRSVPEVQQLATPSPERSGGEEMECLRKASGMLGFLSRKKGRDRSPKARERGVIGKEGARVIVGPGI
jgi:serine/threonine kinase 32